MITPVSTFVHPLVSTQEVNDTTPPCSALGPQLLHDNIGSPVLAGPTRIVTGEAVQTSLAEALTQLSFQEFVQRCNNLIAPFQPTQPLDSISPLDVALQTISPCEVSQDTSTQTSDELVSSLSLGRGSADDFPQCPHLIPGRCRANNPTQYFFSKRFYADGFSLCFLVLC